MNITFTRPEYLLVLFVIPLAIIIHFWTIKRRKTNAINFANFEAIARIKGIDLYSKNIRNLVLTIILLTLLTFSLSGMVVQRSLYSSSFSFVLGIDNSQSMNSDDILPTRLEAAKSVSINFVKDTNIGTRIGVIVFSGTTQIAQPLTNDKVSLRSSIKEITNGEIGGTDISGAIMTATRMLEGEKNKAVIIVSDGQMNIGNLSETIDYAINKEVVIHTIAIGTEEGGQTDYGTSKLDINTLKYLAFNTEGKFFQASNNYELEKDLQSIMQNEIKRVDIDMGLYLLALSIIILIIQFLAINLN
jgi:Ca-activated chloride channel family protein